MPRVLIIEDDAENRRVLAQLFTRDDWKVFQANDGDAGVELALRNRPELILCDLLMPKSNGFEVCRSIREQLQPTKIIVVSAAITASIEPAPLKPAQMNICSNRLRGNCSPARSTGSYRKSRAIPTQNRYRNVSRFLRE